MKKAIEWMQKIQIAVGGFFLCIFLLTVVFQMLSRYIGIAATWTEDVSMYSFIWAVWAQELWFMKNVTLRLLPSAIC